MRRCLTVACLHTPPRRHAGARNRNDRKGGHLVVRRSDGRLVLRDSAMVAKSDEKRVKRLILA